MSDYQEKEPVIASVSKKSTNYIKSLFSARHLLMPNFIKHFRID